MTSKDENSRIYTTISITPSTKQALLDLMPKSWDWDRILLELAEMWQSYTKSGVKTGKSTQDHSGN